MTSENQIQITAAKSFEPISFEIEQNKILIKELKSKLEFMIDLLNTNLLQRLDIQQTEFQQIFYEQMRSVQAVFDDLKNKLNREITKEAHDSKFRKINLEKKFFMEHCLFLNEQNKKLSEKIVKITLKMKILDSECKHLKEMRLIQKENQNLSQKILQIANPENDLKNQFEYLPTNKFSLKSSNEASSRKWSFLFKNKVKINEKNSEISKDKIQVFNKNTAMRNFHGEIRKSMSVKNTHQKVVFPNSTKFQGNDTNAFKNQKFSFNSKNSLGFKKEEIDKKVVINAIHLRQGILKNQSNYETIVN